MTTPDPNTPHPSTPRPSGPDSSAPNAGAQASHIPVFQAPDFDFPQPHQNEPVVGIEPSPGVEPSLDAASAVSRPLLVVDAANVIGSRPDGWWKDRAGAARRLLTNLATYQQGPGADTDITVILEGAARPATDAITSDQSLQVVLAPHSGDDTIVDVVANAAAEDATREITVVTADRGLRARVEPLGATTTGPNWLHTRLETQ